MKKIDGRRRYYQFELKEFYWNMAPPPIILEGGPGGFCDFVSDVVSDVCDTVSDFIGNTIDLLSDPMSIIENPFEFASNAFDCFVDFYENTLEDIEDAVEDAWDSVTEFCSDAWDSVCDVWDEWGKQIIGIVAVVVCSWIPGVNAVVAAAVIGALQAGLESGWDLQAMAVGAAAGAISAYAGGIKTPGLGGTMAKMGCNAASSALQAGQASGWDLSAMGEAALTGAGTSLINGKVTSKLNFSEEGIVGSQTAGRYADNVIKSTVESCVTNGLDSDSVVAGIAGGVGKSVGEYAAAGIDTDNEQVRGLVNTAVSSATSSAILATANGEDVGDAVMNGVSNSTVRYAVKELADQFNDEFSGDGKNQKLEEYLGLVTDAVAGAAGSVSAGGDFNSTFKSELNGNLMAYTKKPEKEMEADYKKNESAPNAYLSANGIPFGAGDPSNNMSLGLDNLDAKMPQDENGKNPIEDGGLSPTQEKVLEKVKNGEEIPNDLQKQLQKELESGIKGYGKELYDDHLKVDVEKNWNEFKEDPLSYVVENPWKTAGAVGLAGATVGGGIAYYNSGKDFDINTGSFGLLKEPIKWSGNGISTSLDGKVGYKRKDGIESMYIDANGQIGYKDGDFSGTVDANFGNTGVNTITAKANYGNFNFNGKYEDNGDNADTTKIGFGWGDNGLKVDGNINIADGELSGGGIKAQKGDFSVFYENNGGAAKAGLEYKHDF